MIILVIVLVVGGLWGIVMSLYDEIEEMIFNPILRSISKQGKKSLPIFIPVAVLFMTIRKAVNLLPLWYALYMIMTLNDYSTPVTYKVITIFCLCAGGIKSGEVIRDYYNPSSRYYDRY